MSLTETVFQLIESDVSQTNDALDNLRRSADDIFDDIKNAQQNTLSFGSLLKEMRSQEENISGRHLIEFESNAEEVTGQTRGMSTQLSAMVASLIQYAGGETDEAFRTLKQEHDDLQNSISETRNAGNAAAAAEIDAQKKVQEALGDTGAAWQAAFDKVAALAEKSLNFAGISTTITGLISDATARAAEIESIDKLGQEISITTQDVDAFPGRFPHSAEHAAQHRLIYPRWQNHSVLPGIRWRKYYRLQIKCRACHSVRQKRHSADWVLRMTALLSC